MKMRQEERAVTYKNQGTLRNKEAPTEFYVTVNGTDYHTKLTPHIKNPDEFNVFVNNSKMSMSCVWPVYAPLLQAKMDDEDIVVQHLGHKTYTLNLGFKGSVVCLRVCACVRACV